MTELHAVGPAFAQREHAVERLVRQHLAERRPRGRQRQRVAGQRPADPADVRVLVARRGADPVGDLGREPVRRDRDPATDRLADHEQVGFEAPGLRRPARPGADRVGLVDQQERAGPPGQLADGVEVSVVRQHDPDVGERRFEQHDRDVAILQCAFEAVDVVELDDARRLGDVDLRPDRALARHRPAAVVEHRERLVDGAVVAVVVDDDLRPSGDLAAEAQREAVRVRGRQRELPVGQPEAALELLADPDRVLGREHVGDAASELPLDRLDRGRGAVPGHRARVAEAEVDVVVAVDAAKRRALGGLDERRERARPADHPVHRDAVVERGLRPLEQLLRARVLGDEALSLGFVERFEPSAVQGLHAGSMRRRVMGRSGHPARCDVRA